MSDIMKVFVKIFQFPFHRDEPCDHPIPEGATGLVIAFQFPFHRDEPCDSRPNWQAGMPVNSFSSLFIGMSLAIGGAAHYHLGSSWSFSSLFIGMSLAIFATLSGGIDVVELSVPFSSG